MYAFKPTSVQYWTRRFFLPPKRYHASPGKRPSNPKKKDYNVLVAGCEHHREYTQFLTDRIAVELLNGGSKDGRCLGEVWSVVNNIAICRTLSNITPEEAEKLTSMVFGLYPQFEEQLKAELAEHFG